MVSFWGMWPARRPKEMLRRGKGPSERSLVPEKWSGLESLESRVMFSAFGTIPPVSPVPIYLNQLGDAVVSSTLGVANEHDYFGFRSNTAGELYVRSSSATGNDLAFYDGPGGPDVLASGLASRPPFIRSTLVANSPSALGVAGFTEQDTGPYTLNIYGPNQTSQEVVIPSTSLQVGVNGTLSGAGDFRFFVFRAPVGRNFTIDATPAGSLDVSVNVFNSQGSAIGGSFTSAINGRAAGGLEQWSGNLTAGSLYYVRVNSEAGTGSFTLDIKPGTGPSPSPDDFGNTASTAAALALGVAKAGNIETVGDADFFRFDAVAGRSYTLETLENAGTLNDTIIRLVDRNGTTTLAEDDDSGPGLKSLINFTASTTGTYYVSVRGYNTGIGTYQLRVSQAGTGTGDDHGNTPATATTLTLGAAIAGGITPAGDADVFAFSTVAGRTYRLETIEGAGTLNDTVIRLLDRNGAILREDDDSGPGLKSLITWTASATGTYYVSVTGYGTGVGTYQLKVSQTTSTPTPQLPDLVVWASPSGGYMYDGIIDTTTLRGRRLYRFSVAMANAGAGPMEVRGGRIIDSDTQEVLQRVYDSNGGYTDTVAGQFVYHPEHGHIHFADFSELRLRQITSTGGVGATVATGHKISFCIIDSVQYSGSLPGSPSSAVYDTCGQFQGLSVGWADVYGRHLPDQWIDVTNVPSGRYWLEVEADPLNHLREADETNNITRIQVNIP